MPAIRNSRQAESACAVRNASLARFPRKTRVVGRARGLHLGAFDPGTGDTVGYVARNRSTAALREKERGREKKAGHAGKQIHARQGFGAPLLLRRIIHLPKESGGGTLRD